MLNSIQVRDQLIRKFNKDLGLAVQKCQEWFPNAHEFKFDLLRGIELKLNLNSGRVAGKAHGKAYSFSNVQLNYKAACESDENFKHILNDTIPHEIAHLVEYIFMNKMSHSRNWKSICKGLGGSGELYHDLEIKPVRAKKQYKYFLERGEVLVSTIRHNRIQRGTVYSCSVGRIDNSLKFVEVK